MAGNTPLQTADQVSELLLDAAFGRNKDLRLVPEDSVFSSIRAAVWGKCDVTVVTRD